MKGSVLYIALEVSTNCTAAQVENVGPVPTGGVVNIAVPMPAGIPASPAGQSWMLPFTISCPCSDQTPLFQDQCSLVGGYLLICNWDNSTGTTVLSIVNYTVTPTPPQNATYAAFYVSPSDAPTWTGKLMRMTGPVTESGTPHPTVPTDLHFQGSNYGDYVMVFLVALD